MINDKSSVQTERAARQSGRPNCASTPDKFSVPPSTTNSSVPMKMLEFIKSRRKYVCEVALLGALSTEPDIESFRVAYETTFGEPLCTFVDDRRVKVVLDLIDCVEALRRKQFFVRCLEKSSHSSASDYDPAKSHVLRTSIEGASRKGMFGKSDEELLTSLHIEVGDLDRRLIDLIRDLHELDPNIASIAAKYAYAS